MIREGQNKGEIRKPNEPNNKYVTEQYIPKTLTDIGITRNESSTFQKIADLLEDLFREKAKEKQSEAGGSLRQKSDKAVIDTKKELAKVAHVSHDTIFTKNPAA